MSRFDNLVASRFEQAEKEGRLNRHNPGEVEEFYNWLRERSRQSYGGRSDYETISAEIEDAIDFHHASLNLDKGFEEQGHFARRTMHGIRRSVEKADKSYQSVWDFGSRVFRLGVVAVGLAAVALISYWFFWSNEASLPKLQRAALENTACRPLSKDQCDDLVSAIERTKSSFAITAANGGNLKPAEEAIQANARKLDANPNTGSDTKAQAAADSAIVSLAISRLEAQMKRTADGVEKIGKSVDTLKRETSSDPRKELQNLGKSFDEQGFIQSMAMCDMRALKLYKDAGMKLPRYKAIEVLVLPSDVSCLELYREEFASYGTDLCLTSKFVNPIYALNTTAVDWLSKAYEIPERKTFVESLCGEAALREKYPQLYGGKSRTVSQLELEMRGRGRMVLSEDQAREEREKIKTMFPGAPDAPTASPSQPSTARAQPANAPPNVQQPSTPAPSEPALAPNYIRANLLSRAIHHGKAVYMYYADGKLEASPDGTSVLTGSYRIEADGRVCWNTSQLGRNCFEYYRRGGTLRVRRADANNRNDIGAVTLAQPASR